MGCCRQTSDGGGGSLCNSLMRGDWRFGMEGRKQDRVTWWISLLFIFFVFLYNVVKAAGVCCLGGRLNYKVLRETLRKSSKT